MTRAPYACDPALSRGREYPIEASLARGPRSAYQRDRDRIVHSIAFRRLRHKTQVFIAPDGDHYRVRLTHSLEVAQLALHAARRLGGRTLLTTQVYVDGDPGNAADFLWRQALAEEGKGLAAERQAGDDAALLMLMPSRASRRGM